MQSTEESLLVKSWIQPHLVSVNEDDFSFRSATGSWGKMEKKILLFSNCKQSAEVDTELINRVLSVTSNYSTDDFFYYPAANSLIPTAKKIIDFSGAEIIFFFNIHPHQVGLFQQGITDGFYKFNQTHIVFLPAIETCVTDAAYKKQFGILWLKLLNTSWIKR